jgi:hypothetical protein
MGGDLHNFLPCYEAHSCWTWFLDFVTWRVLLSKTAFSPPQLLLLCCYCRSVHFTTEIVVFWVSFRELLY